MQVDGWPKDAGPPTIASLTAEDMHSDNGKLVYDLDFGTSNDQVFHGIHDNAIRSLLSNMHSVESDCPTRERVGWTGDSQVR